MQTLTAFLQSGGFFLRCLLGFTEERLGPSSGRLHLLSPQAVGERRQLLNSEAAVTSASGTTASGLKLSINLLPQGLMRPHSWAVEVLGTCDLTPALSPASVVLSQLSCLPQQGTLSPAQPTQQQNRDGSQRSRGVLAKTSKASAPIFFPLQCLAFATFVNVS